MCKKVQFTTATEPPLTDVFQKQSLKISDSALRDASDLQTLPKKATHRSILARCGLTGSVRAAALIGARILAWTWARIAAHFSNRATEPIATTVYFILRTRTIFWKHTERHRSRIMKKPSKIARRPSPLSQTTPRLTHEWGLFTQRSTCTRNPRTAMKRHSNLNLTMKATKRTSRYRNYAFMIAFFFCQRNTDNKTDL